ncbi:MAG: CpaF family protein [Candidatus Hydrogenedentota bacterium]|nr:MAG: CpaF family protein [Candidatus Hydrogenedentota bacterium]
MSLLERLESMKKKSAKPGAAGAAAKVEITPRDQLKKRVQNKLINELDASILAQPDPEIKRSLLRARIEENIAIVGGEAGITLTKREHEEVIKELLDDILGLGPIQPLVDDEEISEIMVNGPNQVYVERGGKLVLTDVKFKDDEAVRAVINKIISPLGRRCDESMPYVDARLKDGSRVNAVIPPLALNGSTITIRKFKKNPLRVPDLIRFGALTQTIADFLRASVMIAKNIVVSGGTGSGKTTLLNALSSFIDPGERICTVEDAAEIQILQPHWVRLETKAANVEGKGAVTMRDLIRNTLRMRPDRVIVGECRGGETLDMLQAMNTGHDGSLTTLHANTPSDAMRRIETMVLMSGVDLPSRAIREQMGSAIHLIVQQTRLPDGSRKITYVTQSLGFDGNEVQMADIFRFVQTGVDDDGKIIGSHQPCHHIPTFYKQYLRNGIIIPLTIFGYTPEEAKEWVEENLKEEIRRKPDLVERLTAPDAPIDFSEAKAGH